MYRFRRLSRPLSYLVTLGMLAASLHWSTASAAIIGTDAAVSAQQVQVERARIGAALEREDVRQALLAAGVDPAQAGERVAALTDSEIGALAARMDEMPAGGDALGVVAFIFVVLLVTDILGLTDIFPFVKKPSQR